MAEAQAKHMTGKERVMGDHDIIVSKTNPKGLITYCNDVCCDIGDYPLAELLGQPHNIIRNPNMPSCVFKLLWEAIQSGKEIFAYVVNLGKKGDHYWVLAHVTPTFDEKNTIIGYHSNRRKPSASALKTIQNLYSTLLKEEQKYSSRREATQAGYTLLTKILEEKGVSYEEFVLSL